MPKLSVKVIEHCPAGQTLWDTDPKGLGFRHQMGGRKAWVFRYTSPVSHQRRQMNLGYYGDHGMSLSAARERAHEVINDVRRGIDPLIAAKDMAQAAAAKVAANESRLTVGQLLDRWVAEHVETELKPNTRYMVGLFVQNQLRPHLGHIPVEDLDLPCLQQEVDALRKVYPGSTVYQAVKWLRAAWRWGRPRLRGFPHWNPFDGISSPYRPKARSRILSKQEYRRLWEVLVGRQPVPVFTATLRALEFLVISGVRKQQALSIRREDIKWSQGIIELNGKMRDDEDCVISEPIAEFLRRRLQETKSEYLFPSPFRCGHPISNIDTAWRKIREQIGLNGVTIHDFRRSYISMSKSAGIAVEDASKVVGHADVSTTQAVYYHLHPDDRKEAADRIASAVVSLRPKPTLDGFSDAPRPPVRNAAMILHRIRKERKQIRNFDAA